MPTDLKSLSPEYATLWDTMEIVRDAAQIAHTAALIIKMKSSYLEVEKALGVPWYVVGILDMREGGGGCRTHLHNGDSLKCRTVSVPAGRPNFGTGPFTWMESAVDALRMKKYDKITEWTIEQMAWCFERYNGFGYRSKAIGIPSPYLWGGTNHQAKGKYISDHVFSKEVMDPQFGCMPLLKVIAEREGIKLVSVHGATSDPNESSPASNRKAEAKPISAVLKENKEVVAAGAAAAGAATQVIPAVPEVVEKGIGSVQAWKGAADAIQGLAPVKVLVAGAVVIAAFVLLKRLRGSS